MGAVKVTEMDHIVLRVMDMDRMLDFYTGILGIPGARVDDFRAGKVGFPSIRISPDTLIDLQPGKESLGDNEKPRNLDHSCLVVEPIDMAQLATDLSAKGVTVVGQPASRWGAHGRGNSLYILDPEGNQIELRCYEA